MLIGKKYLKNRLFSGTKLSENQSSLFLIFSICTILIVVLSVFYDNLFILAIPTTILSLAWIISDLKGYFLALFAILPLSIELELPGGFSTDFPDEPMMVLMMGLIVVYTIKNYKTISSSIILNPITLFLLVHYFWIWTTSLTSMDLVPSIKYSLAKTWYIIVFYFGPLILFKTVKDYRRVFTFVLTTLIFATLFILIRHANHDFAFEMANKMSYPFFRNHVSSSAMMVILLPFVWMLFRHFKNTTWVKNLLIFAMLILMAGIFFSYTRAAIISVFLGVAIYFIVRYRLMIHAISLTLIISILLIGNWAKDNKYLNFAPDFEHTVTHTEFSDLLSATYKLRDISTMERVYRWVAGAHMINEKPILGFGPANFHNNYKSYTLHAFRTYVSANPEKSGVHSYYMMIAIEQGVIGLIIFLFLCFFVLIYGQHIYHKLEDENHRILAISAIISFGIILSILIMNDMVETDKVGPFFFLSMAILVFLDREVKSEQKNMTIN